MTTSTFNINIPDDVYEVMSILNSNNYRVYIVGGSIRDAVIGREPHDFDLCTNSNPTTTMNLLKNNLGNRVEFNLQGIQHFTIKASVDGNEPIDITMFGKSPNFVDTPLNNWYEGTIYDDLHRRDFTMNAMAYTPFPQPTLIDLFNGVRDIRQNKVRFVNLPEHSIKKDPFLILRAFRQTIQLGFSLDKYLVHIMSNPQLLRLMYVQVSGWRKGNELRKILSVDYNAVPTSVNYYIIFLNIITPYLFNETIKQFIQPEDYNEFTDNMDWKDRLINLLKRFDIPNIRKLLMTFEYELPDIDYIVDGVEEGY